MNNTTANADNTPWYRIGMVWLMMGLPMIVVVASMITLAIAYQHAPILVPSKATSVSAKSS